MPSYWSELPQPLQDLVYKDVRRRLVSGTYYGKDVPDTLLKLARMIAQSHRLYSQFLALYPDFRYVSNKRYPRYVAVWGRIRQDIQDTQAQDRVSSMNLTFHMNNIQHLLKDP